MLRTSIQVQIHQNSYAQTSHLTRVVLASPGQRALGGRFPRLPGVPRLPGRGQAAFRGWIARWERRILKLPEVQQLPGHDQPPGMPALPGLVASGVAPPSLWMAHRWGYCASDGPSMGTRRPLGSSVCPLCGLCSARSAPQPVGAVAGAAGASAARGAAGSRGSAGGPRGQPTVAGRQGEGAASVRNVPPQRVNRCGGTLRAGG